jgi:DNA-binding IclR family transcriptional regulator
MDNYYKSPSPQELRYRSVLEAIAALGPAARELVDELDEVVWQIVNRAVDAAIADHDGRILGSISANAPAANDDSRSNSRRVGPI